MQSVRVTRVVQAGGRGASEAWQVVSRQPGWITRAVLLVFLVLLALPFLVLLVLAILAATAVLLVLTVVNGVLGMARRVLGGGGGIDHGSAGETHGVPRSDAEGRANVRVIRRD
jgi:hypothetical protein